MRKLFKVQYYSVFLPIKEVINMVERTKSEGVDQFIGQVVSIDIVDDKQNPGRKQYHIQIEPEDSSLLVGTATGKFHEWLSITKTTTDTSVAEGSKLDNYLKEIEIMFPEAKRTEKIKDVLDLLLNKKIKFVKKVIGKSYEGKESKPCFVPHSLA
jgi:hypothetical protein